MSTYAFELQVYCNTKNSSNENSNDVSYIYQNSWGLINQHWQH